MKLPRTVVNRLVTTLALALALLVPSLSTTAPMPTGVPEDIPPPLPPRPTPDDAFGYEPLVPESDEPWGLSESFLEPLYGTASVYTTYLRRFSCKETARVAKYDQCGGVASEEIRDYGYILIKSPTGNSVRELRQAVTKDGAIKSDEVRDDQPFPPAYAWVFLFSRFNEPYFSFRHIDERFDGFDWVHEIQFKGSLPFTGGKDIREWEGVVLVDAVTYAPIEIRAEPSGQLDRIRALYQRWANSFNFMGLRSGPRPLGFRAEIHFRERRERLAFPTELRYDTFRAVGGGQIIPTLASIRTYRDYLIEEVILKHDVGGQVDP